MDCIYVYSIIFLLLEGLRYPLVANWIGFSHLTDKGQSAQSRHVVIESSPCVTWVGSSLTDWWQQSSTSPATTLTFSEMLIILINSQWCVKSNHPFCELGFFTTHWYFDFLKTLRNFVGCSIAAESPLLLLHVGSHEVTWIKLRAKDVARPLPQRIFHRIELVVHLP